MWASLSGGWSPYSRRWISTKIGSRPTSSFNLGGATELEWKYATPSRALGGREAGREAGRDGWRDGWRDGRRDVWRDEPTKRRALGGRDTGRELAAEPACKSEPSIPTEPACKPSGAEPACMPSGAEPSGTKASGSMVCPIGVPWLACMLACPDACAARPRDS